MKLWLKIMASLVGAMAWVGAWNFVFQFLSMPDTFVNIGGILLGMFLIVTPIVVAVHVAKKIAHEWKDLTKGL